MFLFFFVFVDQHDHCSTDASECNQTKESDNNEKKELCIEENSKQNKTESEETSLLSPEQVRVQKEDIENSFEELFNKTVRLHFGQTDENSLESNLLNNTFMRNSENTKSNNSKLYGKNANGKKKTFRLITNDNTNTIDANDDLTGIGYDLVRDDSISNIANMDNGKTSNIKRSNNNIDNIDSNIFTNNINSNNRNHKTNNHVDNNNIFISENNGFNNTSRSDTITIRNNIMHLDFDDADDDDNDDNDNDDDNNNTDNNYNNGNNFHADDYNNDNNNNNSNNKNKNNNIININKTNSRSDNNANSENFNKCINKKKKLNKFGNKNNKDSTENSRDNPKKSTKPSRCELILESSLLFYNQNPSLGCLRQTTVSAVNTAAAPSKIMGDTDLLGADMHSNAADLNDGASTIITSKYPAGLSAAGMSVAGAPASTTATAVAAAAAATAAGVPKRPVRRGGKAQPDRPVRALFCLGLKNPLRKLCIDVVEWKYPFKIKKFYLLTNIEFLLSKA